MNPVWSEMNRSVQELLKKESTFQKGIHLLLQLRDTLFQWVLDLKETIEPDMFFAMPYLNANGYHNKTIAYSLWHIFRIEDIVAHSLIKKDMQIFFLGDYQSRIKSPIITTGNELIKEEIQEFSKCLDMDSLYEYITEVKASTDQILKDLKYQDLKIKLTEEDRIHLEAKKVVSTHERAFWLLDYWCHKDIRGLIQMPFSRHWIMHIEASMRIYERLVELKS